MTSRTFATLVLGAGLCFGLLQPLGPLRAAGRPNVLFLFSDDQRADTIAALGNTRIRTPNLDRLVQQGAAFTRNYYMGAWQGAVCAPSRAMLMSGRTINHVKENLAGCTTWPEQFAKTGYATFITGKWHNSPQSVTRVFQEGKAVFIGGMGNPYKLPVSDISPEHRLVNQRTSGVHSVQLFADCAIEFLKRQKPAKPFLCYVAFNCPHDPRVAPDSYREPYNANKPPLPANFLPLHPFNNGDLAGRDEQLAPWPRTPEIVRQHLADYYSYITYLDDQIGRILAALKETGQYENTIIVFSSDNGLAIGSHGLFGKQNLYDHSTHLPLVFAGPGILKGRTTDVFSYLIDIFPTLGAYCGVLAPDGNEGLSLKPILQGQSQKVRDSIFTSYKKIQRAVRDDRWHLIVYTRINKTQLFDLQNDPSELKDLAPDPAYAGEVKRMTALLKDWQQKMDDDLPLTIEKPDLIDFDFSKVKRPKETTDKQKP